MKRKIKKKNQLKNAGEVTKASFFPLSREEQLACQDEVEEDEKKIMYMVETRGCEQWHRVK